MDVYGTLLDTHIYRSSLRNIVEDLGLSDDQRKEAVELVLTTHFSGVREMAKAIERRFSLGPTADSALRRTEEEIAEHLMSFKLFEGVPEVISELRSDGRKLALVTNVSSPYLEPILRLGVNKLVDQPVYSCLAGCKKPDPEIFRIAMNALGTGPGETVMVGDNPRDDIAGAVAAGIRSILIEPEIIDHDADMTVGSIGEIPGAVRGLSG